MKVKLAVLVAAVAAAAFLVSMDDSRRDVLPVLEIREEGDGFDLIAIDGGATGPESVAFDGHGGGPYTGVSDGRVLRWMPGERRWVEHSSSSSGPELWRPAERRWEEHSCSAPGLLESCRGSQDPAREHECGRPLGLKFNNETGELYVADAYHGLRVVGPDDKVSRPLVREWQGSRPFSFANGVEIDHETGAIYFTETSTRFQRREFLSIVISGDKTGRLLKYDPKSNHVEVLVDGLSFPNGLAISADGTYLLLAETTTGKILKYWIKTAKASTMEEVVQLSWFPDNIKWSPRGGFWVGLHAKRGKIAEWSISYPWLRRLILKLPMRHVQRVSTLLSQLGRQVIALRLSEEGKTIEAVSVHGDVQKAFKSVSEVEERNGSLFMGSVTSPFLGVYRL
ncbi:hypothetical protein EJB05_55027 [Eragrostis curvula]|uniref:Strictosidine synthase conserved region domain-containing protein n=1 Tax=Eragrostis curvula TaxID=38414 RepID=A0A5J9SKT2_9POAL|nr:hypothetical protein EJB05_55027 [Eragrostis curvula]